MIIDDHCEIDEYFNEDIFCDFCHSMWPEMVYVEHWEICRNSKVVKKQQQKKLEQELRVQAAIQRKKRVERERKEKKNGRRKFFFVDQMSEGQIQIRPEPGRTVNTQIKEGARSIHSSSTRRAQRISQPTRNGNLIQCMGCGRQMNQHQFDVHPAFCEYPPAQCPHCRQYFLQQLLPLHKLNCSRNNGSQPQNPPQPPPRPSPPPVESQYNFGNHNLTPQALQFMQRLWSEAKNKDKGLKQQQIKMFENQKYEKKEDQQEPDTCTVCFEELQDGEDYISLPCKHVFHAHCIKQWIKRIAQCPNCKFNIKENFVVKQ